MTILKRNNLLMIPGLLRQKELISEAIKEYQNLFTQKIRPPQKSIESHIEKYNKLRGGNLFFHILAQHLVMGVKYCSLMEALKWTLLMELAHCLDIA